VSLIDIDAIILARLNFDVDFTPAETRRNLVTRDVELNDLIDREFTVGAVRMIGRSLCDPCARPARLANKDQDFTAAFENNGGLRAEILTSGIIAVGATVLIQ
jgi:MOSC domain-containing protein YiiM